MLQLSSIGGDTSPIPSVRIPARKWSSRLCSTRSLRENKNYKSGLPDKFRSRRRIWKLLCWRLWLILEAISEWSLVTTANYYDISGDYEIIPGRHLHTWCGEGCSLPTDFPTPGKYRETETGKWVRLPSLTNYDNHYHPHYSKSNYTLQDYVVEGSENVLEGRDNLAVDPVQSEDNSTNGELKIPRNYQETITKVRPVRSKQSQTEGIPATLYKTL